jgi:hypothetical protein
VHPSNDKPVCIRFDATLSPWIWLQVDDVLFHQEVKKHLVADFVMRALAEDKGTTIVLCA